LLFTDVNTRGGRSQNNGSRGSSRQPIRGAVVRNAAEGGELVRVAAAIIPVSAPDGSEPQWRFYELPARTSAQLVDDTLETFPYLGCTIREMSAQEAKRTALAA
jgi:hypothetical protein